MESTPLVINTFRERNIPIDRNKVLSVFSNAGGAAAHAKWVTEHITSELLLSQEEFTLHSALEKSGVLSKLLNNRSTRATRPFLEKELQQAIDSLNASTTAILRQKNIFSSQCETMNRRLYQKEKGELGFKRDAERLRLKTLSGRQTATAVFLETSLELELDVKSELEKVATEGRRLLSSLTTRLKDDEKTLAHLERVAHGIEYAGNDASISRQATDLGVHHAQYVAGEIEHRLDRLYLEIVQKVHGVMQDETTRADSDVSEALEAELGSLYSEIGILAELSTIQQLVDPIHREIQSHHGALCASSNQKLHLIGGILSQMVVTMRECTKGLQEQDSSCGTLEAFTAAYKTEIGELLLASSAPKQRTVKIQVPRAASLNISSRGHSVPLSEVQALAALIRRVGLTLENLSLKARGGLINSLQEKRRNLVESSKDYGLAADSPLKAALFPTDSAIQFLLPRLQTSSGSKASLSNIDHKLLISELEAELGLIQERVKRLKPDMLSRSGSRLEIFLKRWEGQVYRV
ncbi:hypothetical protein ASPACDRAFT_74934 [Aspergillus aculeatus ATCC 16872]|uniref:HAUS augmin-like complex subunit 3 N-terminal domain-containing protein n=1 Tax=Aspergillus aculeatus (strain ATCC 16872 / CBS 172.66 / WB 5094) TaxID=690307 RepID=A0A1L9X4E3_ASPA1|nr:uncharacterized protein ASPACDRAFT_74934 [Aspergillus aculeatus ATCC 16872]OJK03343.1 hypothetical protein ASPACDRAFT_74934 [Aspergillus aculeatus ATCC 16872]